MCRADITLRRLSNRKQNFYHAWSEALKFRDVIQSLELFEHDLWKSYFDGGSTILAHKCARAIKDGVEPKPLIPWLIDGQIRCGGIAKLRLPQKSCIATSEPMGRKPFSFRPWAKIAAICPRYQLNFQMLTGPPENLAFHEMLQRISIRGSRTWFDERKINLIKSAVRYSFLNGTWYTVTIDRLTESDAIHR